MSRKQFFFLSVASGILLSLPWLFPGLGWVLFFSFIPLLTIENQLSGQNNPGNSVFFIHAFVGFLIWNVLSTWWIAYVSFSGMMFITVANAGLMASVWWLMHVIRNKFGAQSGYFSLVIFWITLEFLQHHWTIPWPWLTLGNGLANSVKIIQWYEFTGVLGGSFWILLSNILIFLAAKSFLNKLFLKAISCAGYALIVVFLPLFGSLYLYSSYFEKGISQNVTVLQPNIDPYTEKFSGISTEEQICLLLSLAETTLSDSVDLILAPETALPLMWEEDSMIRNQSLSSISEIIERYPDVRIIAGAITQRKIGKGEVISETARQSTDGLSYYDLFNSALLINSTSEVQISHKSILVNGVERMPFQKYFSFLGEYNLYLGGTSGSLAAANEPVLFSVNDSVRIGSVICFESVFGEFCGTLVKKGANMLVVLTNDGWWKDSSGCWQHFGYSRLRAVETRRSIARCANTGISGFINQRGDVLKRTRLNYREASNSPILLNTELTFYSIHGDYIGKISMFFSILALAYLLIYHWRKRGEF